tara:strand:+ start:341 stop:544 length:204 start_codon:yes stop_codon:yes gene_type:complete
MFPMHVPPCPLMGRTQFVVVRDIPIIYLQGSNWIGPMMETDIMTFYFIEPHRAEMLLLYPIKLKNEV